MSDRNHNQCEVTVFISFILRLSSYKVLMLDGTQLYFYTYDITPETPKTSSDDNSNIELIESLKLIIFPNI